MPRGWPVLNLAFRGLFPNIGFPALLHGETTKLELGQLGALLHIDTAITGCWYVVSRSVMIHSNSAQFGCSFRLPASYCTPIELTFRSNCNYNNNKQDVWITAKCPRGLFHSFDSISQKPQPFKRESKQQTSTPFSQITTLSTRIKTAKDSDLLNNKQTMKRSNILAILSALAAPAIAQLNNTQASFYLVSFVPGAPITMVRFPYDSKHQLTAIEVPKHTRPPR
jgi:hypothetical protein